MMNKRELYDTSKNVKIGILVVILQKELHCCKHTLSASYLRWAGHVARMGEERKLYRVLVGKPEGRRPLGRPRRRCEDGIRMDIREIFLGCMDLIRLAQDRDQWRAVVSAVMNLRVLAPRRLLS
jgi:hypothetical protein